MNAKQRRVAYRKQPKPGSLVSWKLKSGKVITARVVGPSMIWDHKHPDAWDARKTPDTSRVCVEHIDHDTFRSHPLVSKLI